MSNKTPQNAQAMVRDWLTAMQIIADGSTSPGDTTVIATVIATPSEGSNEYTIDLGGDNNTRTALGQRGLYAKDSRVYATCPAD